MNAGLPRLLAACTGALLLPFLCSPAAGGEATIVHAGWLLAEPGKPPLQHRGIVEDDEAPPAD